MKPNLFNSVKLSTPKTSKFDLTHDVKQSMNPGFLCPTLTLECVPGDKFNLACHSLTRMAPMIAPLMHRVDVSMHYFFVPNRILWDNWEKFIVDNDADTAPAFPTVQHDQDQGVGTLADYLGLPPIANNTFMHPVNAMPFAAYQAIYDQYYRDENLVTGLPDKYWKLIDGDNSLNAELFPMRRRAWEHDYFTSALPFAQKGQPVTIPIAGFNDVPVASNVTPPPARYEILTSGNLHNFQPLNVPTSDPDVESGELYAQTSLMDAQEATITDLRRAFKLQEWLERNARAGTRYTEHIRAMFGVTPSDARLQRPEYITGSKTPIIISEVLNTAGAVGVDAGGPEQGNMSGHGIGVAQGGYGNYFCEEHGFIIGIMSIMPKTAYQDGAPKHWFKYADPFQYYQPLFAHIGEQPVEQRELYINTLTPEATFGYVPRYSEYKFINARVAGEFRTTLDYWHWGRIFSTEPALNSDFIECDPSQRIFAVTDDSHKFYCQILHNISAFRRMPRFGNPQM